MSTVRLLPGAAEAYAYPLLIKNLLLSGVRYERNREIVYRDLVRYNYQEFNRRVARLANVLTDMGVRQGDMVAVMDWDSHRYLECMFAVPMIGAILHTVNIRLSPEQILYTMNHAEDRFVLVNSEFAPLYQPLAEQLPTVQKTILLDDSGNTHSDLKNMQGEYETLLAAASDTFDFPDFDENAIATTFYTTGTTGNPKGVFFSHRQLVLHSITQATGSALDNDRVLGSNDVYMPITPMFHVHAWGFPYTATMLGMKQVYPGRYDPDILVRLRNEEKVTFSHCVPTILQMLLNCETGRKSDLTGWKMIIGGSALPRGLMDTATAVGMRLSAGYGMSETCPLISVSYLSDDLMAADPETQVTERRKAGVPLALVDARLMTEQGEFLPHDGETQGELVLRTPWLSQSYFKDTKRGDELWKYGWLHTGDVATIDEHGIIDIRDRIKDVIKTGGEWLSSLDLESLISQHPSVQETAVIGVPDPRWDERPFALVKLQPGQCFDAAALEKHLKPYVETGKINKWAIPKQIAVVEEIPKTSVGKLDKKQMRILVDQWIKEGSPVLSSH